MNAVVVHKTNQTGEIKKCVSNVRKAKMAAQNQTL